MACENSLDLKLDVSPTAKQFNSSPPSLLPSSAYCSLRRCDYVPPLSTKGPLQSIVSMGSRHLVPHKGVYQGDLYPPLGLIQWIYQMERDRKVRVADINVPARPKLHQTNVRKSSTRPAAALKTFQETETIQADVKGEIRPLPLQSLQDAVMVEVQLSDSSDPGVGGAVSGEAGEGTRE
ncbi:unnamed protein product [Pleuronectes platessa]|uniref:Uncharacterized protein n=1 Tax=Pleuronectes platessa TaxID=8262 RepID=A0A9N7UNZ1_PLEPL|nr:unnamed protein product [Pleuronectes platessa]